MQPVVEFSVVISHHGDLYAKCFENFTICSIYSFSRLVRYFLVRKFVCRGPGIFICFFYTLHFLSSQRSTHATFARVHSVFLRRAKNCLRTPASAATTLDRDNPGLSPCIFPGSAPVKCPYTPRRFRCHARVSTCENSGLHKRIALPARVSPCKGQVFLSTRTP